MSKELEYDIVAIGGGTAGLVTAAGAAYLGAQPGLVESAARAGDWPRNGCVRAKPPPGAAPLAHSMRHAEKLGLVGAAPVHAFSEVMERMRRARGVVVHHADPDRFRDMGVSVHFGNPRLLDPQRLEADGVGR